MKKNLFVLPRGAAGKKHVEEVTGLIKLWIQHTPLKSISLKVVNVMLRYLSENQANPQKASA